MNEPEPEQYMPNPEKLYAAITTGIAFLAAVLIFLPGWIGIDGMDGGYALSFISTWIALSAALVAWYFWWRASQLDRLIAGETALAHWQYTPAEWQAFTGTELIEQTRENRGLWFFMAGMCLLLGALFWLFDREAGLFVLLVMAGVTVVLAAAAFGLPRLRYTRRQSRPGEAWLSPSAVYFDGVFVPWNLWESRLDKVDWQEATGTAPACLRFHLVHIVSIGIQVQTLRVPVPHGRTEEARALLDRFITKSSRNPRRRTA